MKLAALKSETQLRTRNDKGLGVQNYGERNDYPQKLMEVVGASVTGGACVGQFAKFVFGRGFRAREFYKAVINAKGETADDVLNKVAHDLAMFGGFALHFNWNALHEITSVAHLPFEWLRLQALKDDYTFDKIAMHPDWGRRYTALRPFRQKDIVWFDFYDPEKIDEQVKAAGGWDKWNGQVLYFSSRGDKCYPLPVYDAALTDMSAEEGLSNVSYRNIRNNFLPCGMFIDHDNRPESESQEDETRKELAVYQGDANAGRMMYINLKMGEQEPEFKPFETNNTDKKFTNSNNDIPDRIGAAFCQPPILRAKDVGSNFGATAMKEAYDFYNSQTDSERLIIERVFAEVMVYYKDINAINPEADYSILPKEYKVTQTLAERLGERTDKALEILFDTSKPLETRKATLEVMFGIEPEEVERLTEKLQ